MGYVGQVFFYVFVLSTCIYVKVQGSGKFLLILWLNFSPLKVYYPYWIKIWTIRIPYTYVCN